MKALLATFLAGVLFGLGLVVSGMTNPAKVIGFLDLFGDWDPSLALVMGAALVVTGLGYRIVWRAVGPLFSADFQLPANRRLDTRLLGGALLFGIGWGLVGLCPGPALTALASAEPVVLVFVVAMLVGIGLHRLLTVIETRKDQDASRDSAASSNRSSAS